MTVRRIAELLEADIHAGREQLDLEVRAAFGADLMSDVMAFARDRVVLLTGLVNAQTLRTAELLDIKVVVFVRGKRPNPAMIEMGRESGLLLLSTRLPMFLACGRLYEAGLRTSPLREIA